MFENFQTFQGVKIVRPPREAIAALSETALQEIHNTFLNGFGLQKGWSLEGIHQTLLNSNMAFLLQDRNGVNCGYAMYDIPNERLDGRALLWENAICFRKDLQGQGVSRKIFQEILEMPSSHDIGYIGGRTQNPIVMTRYSGFGPAYPFDKSYLSEDGQRLLGFLRRNVQEVSQIKTFNEASGIGRSVYRGGRLGDYPVDESRAVESYLRLHEFKRENGDAVVIVSDLNGAPERIRFDR